MRWSTSLRRKSRSRRRRIEEKFGSFAEVYAENRIEAADIAGNDAGKDHWQKVAAELPREDDK